jgi:hypothetical protein
MKKLLPLVLIVTFTAACGPTPPPTPNVSATTTAIAKSIMATMTAQAPTDTPTPTNAPEPTPTTLPTLAPSTLLPLPAEVGLDAYRTAMRPGDEDDVLTMDDLPRYRLGLQVDLDQGLLRGREELLFVNHEGETLKEIVLRLYANLHPLTEEDNLRVGSVTVDGEPVQIRYTASNTAVVVPLPHPLPPDASTRLEMDFTTPLGSARWAYWGLASFYPLLAVHDETGWREDIAPSGDLVYSESALYTVALTLSGEMIVGLRDRGGHSL